MTTHPPTRPIKPSEEGYMLVAVMFMLAILLISLTIAAPKIAKSIQRDRELETMHRGKQYARAIKLYYKQFNTYPPNLDALVKTNEIRFLRKKYIDPTTGKDEWKPIRFGQQKTQSTGFFGKPISGTGMTGGGLNGAAGMNGVNGQPGASPIGGIGSSTNIGAGGIGSNASPPGVVSTGGSATSNDNSNGTATTNGSTSPSGTGQPTTAADGTTTTDASNPTASTNPTGTGQTMGGVGIIGFSPNSPKQSILVYKKKSHYNEWEFIYDPLVDQMMMQGGNAGTIGTPAGNLNGNSPTGNGTGIGGASPTGGINPGGAAPSAPTTPTPQQ